MVSAKKYPQAPDLKFKKHLEYLYARRSAIDELIESLESYSRIREKGNELRRQKTA